MRVAGGGWVVVVVVEGVLVCGTVEVGGGALSWVEVVVEGGPWVEVSLIAMVFEVGGYRKMGLVEREMLESLLQRCRCCIGRL